MGLTGSFDTTVAVSQVVMKHVIDSLRKIYFQCPFVATVIHNFVPNKNMPNKTSSTTTHLEMLSNYFYNILKS
jgi:hypothetical protein